MGDKVVISNIEFLYGRLFQIDLHNESKDEYYRMFAEKEELYNMLNSAILEDEGKGGSFNSGLGCCTTCTFR